MIRVRIPMQPGKDLLWERGRGRGRVEQRKGCETRKDDDDDDDDERSMKKNSRGAVEVEEEEAAAAAEEEEAGVVSPDSTNKNSSHLYTAGLFKDYLNVVVVVVVVCVCLCVCLVLYQQTADLFLPTLQRLRTISTLHATMTQEAHNDIKFIPTRTETIFSPCLRNYYLQFIN